MALAKNSIFISYRKNTASDWVAKLADDLRVIFGEDAVFVDYSTGVPYGTERPEKILAALDQCRVLLPVIDPSWNQEPNLGRLKEPDDWVRKELITAHARQPSVLCISVFVNGETALAPERFVADAELHKVIYSMKYGPRLTMDRGPESWPKKINFLVSKIGWYLANFPENSSDNFSWGGAWEGVNPSPPAPPVRLAARRPSRPRAPATSDGSNTTGIKETVEFSAFAPRLITPDSSFVLEVWAYLLDQYESVSVNAQKSGRESEVGRKAGVSVKRGVVINITLEIDKLQIPDPVDEIVWNGSPTNASFPVDVPGDVEAGNLSGKAVISCEGIFVAKVPFIVAVGKKRFATLQWIFRTTQNTKVSGQPFVPKTAFASYSSNNREEVLTRIHGMKKVAPNLDVFVDRISFRSGDRWEKELENEITSKDIFYLFWSQDAAHSKWVDKEWRMALRRRGLDYIDPVPLEEPEHAPPPDELKALHFSDVYLSYINSARQ